MPRIHKKLHPIPTLNPTSIPNFFITTHSKIPSTKPYFKQVHNPPITHNRHKTYFETTSTTELISKPPVPLHLTPIKIRPESPDSSPKTHHLKITKIP